MSHIILIRELRANDNIAAREVFRHALISLVNESFISTLLKEITFQLIVLTAAIMFIFIGFPITYCIISVPMVLILIYISIYSAHLMKSIEGFQGKPLQCWVAEACEPFFFIQPPQMFPYKILTEQDLKDQGIDIGNRQRKVIGTIAVVKHRTIDNSCWAFRLAVNNRYRKKGIGTALAQTLITWTKDRHFDRLECAVSENQETARQLLSNSGFQLVQMYHKHIIGGAFTVLKFQMGMDLNPVL